MRIYISNPLLLAGVIVLATMQAPAKADALAYAAISGPSTAPFGIQNLTTGTFTLLGTMQTAVDGLGEIGAILYAVGTPGTGTSQNLYTVNPANGNLTLVGTGSASISVFGSTTSGLYGLDYSSVPNLYSINPTTGASTLIGSTGITSFISHNGLSTGSSTLYLTVDFNAFSGPGNLYSLDTLTGVATLLGTSSPASAAVFGPVMVDGQLFAGSCANNCSSPGSIYTIDTTSGAVTFVSAISGATNIFDGMAPVIPTYNLCFLYDPTLGVHSGATLPVKLELCDGSGNDLSSSNLTLHAVSVTQISTSTSGQIESPGNANPDNDFRFEPTLGGTGGYIMNLKTTGLTTGTYDLNFIVTGDPFVYAATFQIQ